MSNCGGSGRREGTLFCHKNLSNTSLFVKILICTFDVDRLISVSNHVALVYPMPQRTPILLVEILTEGELGWVEARHNKGVYRR